MLVLYRARAGLPPARGAPRLALDGGTGTLPTESVATRVIRRYSPRWAARLEKAASFPRAIFDHDPPASYGGSSMPGIVGVHHTRFTAARLDRSLAFFRPFQPSRRTLP